MPRGRKIEGDATKSERERVRVSLRCFEMVFAVWRAFTVARYTFRETRRVHVSCGTVCLPVYGTVGQELPLFPTSLHPPPLAPLPPFLPSFSSTRQDHERQSRTKDRPVIAARLYQNVARACR